MCAPVGLKASKGFLNEWKMQKKEIKKVNTVGRSWQTKECRDLVQKLAGTQFNTEANFRTEPVKHDSDIQNR